MIGDDFNNQSKRMAFLNKMSNNRKNKWVYEAVVDFSKESKKNIYYDKKYNQKFTT